MGVLTESPQWDSPIYLIERSDPVMGGEHGVNNVQARQLANRLQYLRALFLLEHNDDGSHALTEASVAPDAGIVESKLKLPMTTTWLYSRYEAAAAILDELNTALDSVEGLEGTPLRTFYEALLISWKYGYPRFAFEMFSNNFSLRDIFAEVPLLETIAGDDSIDVADSGTLSPGEAYILWDKNHGDSRIVTVKEILTNHRVILWETEDRTRFGSGFLSKTSWKLETGHAQATAGSYYISKFCNLLDGFERGKLVISHKEDVTFHVEHRPQGSTMPTDWQPVSLQSRWYSDECKSWRSAYEIPGGIQSFRIRADGATSIDHMVIMTDSAGALPSTVRTPGIIDPAFKVRRFGALYGATHTRTQIEISPDANFLPDTTQVLEFPASGDRNPEWDFLADVSAAYPLVNNPGVYWRVRYEASDGYWSLWSSIAQYT